MSQWCFLLARTAAGVRRTVPFTVADDAAKGGLVPLTRSPARAWGRYGVTVNAVAAALSRIIPRTGSCAAPRPVLRREHL